MKQTFRRVAALVPPLALAFSASVAFAAAPFVINNVQITGGTITGLSSPLPIASGGTASATQSGALTNILGSSTVPVANGGTGATTAGGAQTNLGLGTAATANTGTSGGTVPLLNAANTWSAVQSFSASPTASADYVRGGAAGTNRGIQYFTASTLRWYEFVDSVSEGGSNAGSNYNLSRYSDAGSFLDTPFSILRSSGAVTIKGSQTNDSAAAGFVGEYVTNTTTGTSLTSGTIANCTSVSLTAGDWDVSGVTRFNAGSATAITNFQTGINTTSATFAGLGTQQTLQTAWTSSVSIDELATPVVRQSLSATTTVYLPAVSTFSGTMTCNGFIRARRVR